MQEAIRNSAVMGVLALLSVASFWGAARRPFLAPAAACLGLLLAAFMGMLQPLQWRVWAASLPLLPLCMLLLWWWAGTVLQELAASDDTLPGAATVFLGAAALGAPAVGLAHARRLSAKHAHDAATVILLASAGAVCGPLGNEMALVLGAGVPVSLLPLGLLLFLAAWPWSLGWRGGALSLPPLALIYGLAVMAGPVPALFLLVAIAVVMSLLFSRKSPSLGASAEATPPRRWGLLSTGSGLCWAAATLVSIWLLLPASLLALITDGVAEAETLLRGTMAPLYSMAAMFLAVLGTALPVAWMAALLEHCGFAALPESFVVPVIAGASVGAGLPLMAMAGGGTLKAGLPRWSIQVLLVVLYLFALYWS